jgi:hypothetical protein|nr:MAG TPA: hypothetical protein [Caudoviricetes sp.]
MYEFFSMVWRYVLEHSTAFITFITSSGFLSAFLSVILTVKTRKSAKENTAATRELSAVMEQNKALAGIVRALADGNRILQEKVEEALEMEDRIMAKTNAVLEVEYIKNGATANAKTRVDVNNVINNAKYSETGTRAAIAKENAELRAKIAAIAEEAEKSTENVDKIVAAGEQSAVLMRG